MFGLSQQFFKRGKYGFTSAIITGRRRIGKTMYSLQTVYQICKFRGDDEDQCWNTALHSVVFSMDDLIRIIKAHKHTNRRDFVIWDDSGVYGGSLLYLYNINNAMVLKSLMDTIGTRVKLLLLTCPNASGLMKFLRNYGDYIIHVAIAPGGGGDRRATVYNPYLSKNFCTRWGKAWADDFNVKIPKNIYQLYVEERDEYSNKILRELTKLGKKGKRILDANEIEGDELVRQDRLQSDVAGPDFEGSI